MHEFYLYWHVLHWYCSTYFLPRMQNPSWLACVCVCVCWTSGEGSSGAAQSSDLKVLEAEDVKDANGFEVFLPFDLLVDPEDDPGEALGIQRHGNRVPGVYGLKR